MLFRVEVDTDLVDAFQSFFAERVNQRVRDGLHIGRPLCECGVAGIENREQLFGQAGCGPIDHVVLTSGRLLAEVGKLSGDALEVGQVAVAFAGDLLEVTQQGLNVDGRRIDATWIRPTLRSAVTLIGSDGTPIELAPGRTWVQLLDATTPWG